MHKQQIVKRKTDKMFGKYRKERLSRLMHINISQVNPLHPRLARFLHRQLCFVLLVF